MTQPAPPAIGRQAAQRLARAELSKPIYHHSPPLLQRVLSAVGRWLGRLFHLADHTPGGWWAVVALAAVAVIVTATVVAWVGPVARSNRHRRAMTPAGQARTARDHREEAAGLAEAGDFSSAVRECLRAIAAELDERGVLPSRPGWTAHEFAEEAARALSEHTAALREAAALFDEVCYGQRPGTAEGYERLSALDAAVRARTARVRPADDQRPPAAVGGRAS